MWTEFKSFWTEFNKSFESCWTGSALRVIIPITLKNSASALHLGSWHDSRGNPWGHAVTKASFKQRVQANVQLKSNIPIGAKLKSAPISLH